MSDVRRQRLLMYIPANPTLLDSVTHHVVVVLNPVLDIYDAGTVINLQGQLQLLLQEGDHLPYHCDLRAPFA